MDTIRALATLTAAAALVAAAPTADASQRPDPSRAQARTSSAEAAGPMGAGWFGEVNFPSLDGTMLHADVLLPAPPDEAPEGGWPMIVSGGPYFSASKYSDPVVEIGPNPLATGPVERFADFIEGAEIFANGYGWAQVDTRGYGSSGGCNDYGGIGEQSDMAASVEYFGTQDYSNGKVGLWGKSYDAWTQVMALAQNPEHLSAAVIQAPLIEGYRLAWDNGVHWDAGWYATTGLYALYDNEPVGTDADAQEHAQSTESTAVTATCWAENAGFASVGYDRELPYWQERNLIPDASASMVPTFWTMGFQDTNTKPTNLLDVYGELPGYRKGWFGHWAHVRGNEVNREDFFIEVMDFLEVTLKGKPQYDLPINLAEQTRIQTQYGDWYVADTFPPSDVELFPLELNTGSYVDTANAGSDDGLWTFTEPLPYSIHWSGEPVFTGEASVEVPMSNLLTRIYAVQESGKADLIARGAQLLEDSGEFAFHGWPSDYVLEEGMRLAVQFTSTSAEHNPINTGGEVQITSASVALPFRTLDSVYDEYTDVAFPPYVYDLRGVDADAATVAWDLPPETGSTDAAPAPAPAPAPEPAPAAEPLPATGGGLAVVGLLGLAAAAVSRRRA